MFLLEMLYRPLYGSTTSMIANIMPLSVVADKVITIITKGLAGARRPKHTKIIIIQATSILRKGAGSEFWGAKRSDHRALANSLYWSKQAAANRSCSRPGGFNRII